MLKPTVKRGLMLDFILDEISCPTTINPSRIFALNNKPINDGDIVYLATRELRLEDNYAVLFGLELAHQHNKKFKIVVVIDKILHSDYQSEFLKEGLNFFEKNSALNSIEFEIVQEVPQNAAAIIVDFNPIDLQIDFAKNYNCAVFEVDSHNIIPARFISNKQEFSAATLRRKVYSNIADFLTEFPCQFKITESSAQNKLNDFIENKLDFYTELKNNPNKNVTSNLSPYLHFGFISAQRIALEVLKSKTSRDNKEAFLEELIVRKELADNFCLYNPNFKSITAAATWAQTTLSVHKPDIRTYIYNLRQFEDAQTHDELWNAIQIGLIKFGKIHGYLRMYWAKKILEWSKSPEEALEIAIYLNDKYALDGNDSNGYVGILWSICGVHDRPFSNRLTTGKIRYMSLAGCKKKFDINQFLLSMKN